MNHFFRRSPLLLALLLLPAMLRGQAPDRGITVQQGGAGARIALVVGNSSYGDAPLRNPVNDARDISKALRETGFEVLHVENAGQMEMKRAVQEFGRRLRPGVVGLFYYAGHGIQARGKNWLIPTDARIDSEGDLVLWGIDMDGILGQLEDAGNSLNIVILDACRNNPFARSYRSASQGLAQVNAPTGTFIAYATAPGSVASDGEGSNGLYTRELLRFMRVPGLPVEEVFKQVRIAVREASNRQQTPWESSALIGGFSFVPTGGGGAALPSPTRPEPARNDPPAPRPERQEPRPEPVRNDPSPVNRPPATGSETEREARWAQLFNDGVAAYGRSDLTAAAALWEEAAWVYDLRPEAQMNLAALQTRRQRYDEAIRWYREALRAAEARPTARTLSAQEVTERAEARESILKNLVEVLVYQGRQAEAESVLRQQLSIRPGDAALQRQLAQAVSAQPGRAEEARRMLEGVGGRAEDHFNMGVAFFGSKSYLDAAAAFDRVVSTRRGGRDGWYNLANSLYAANAWARVVPAAERLIGLDPLNENAGLILARAYRETGNVTGAAREVKRLETLPVLLDELTLSPGSSPVLRGTITGRSAPAGTAVRIRVTFYAEDDRIVDERTVSIFAPARGAKIPFEATSSAAGVVAYRYERTP